MDSFSSIKQRNLRIALFCGGYSAEACISYESADFLLSQVQGIGGEWVKVDLQTPEKWIALDNKKEYPIFQTDCSYSKDKTKISFDVAVICVHGTPGEDGTLQCYFDRVGIPYIGNKESTSKQLFNKFRAGEITASVGIAVPAQQYISKEADRQAKISIKTPCIIKPNQGGSSIGVIKLERSENIREKLVHFFENTNSSALIQEFIGGREFSVGVYRDGNGQVVVLPMTEILHDQAFFDYDAKYLGKSQEVTPAEIEDDLKQEIKETATKLYNLFECQFLVRIDFLTHGENKKLYFLEINTVPGLGEKSIIPQQLRSAKLKFATLYEQFLVHVLKRKNYT